jgi:8-oxo-dGTP diphosphatase
MDKKAIVQKVVLGAIVEKEGKILILQRNADEDVFPNMWELPSGKKEPLETYDTALVREVEEETGLKVTIICPVSVFNYQIEKPTEIRDSTQINFLVQPLNEEVTLSPEHQKYDWVEADDIEKFNLSHSTKETILKGFEVIKNRNIGLKI